MITQKDGPGIVITGKKMAKKRNPVYLQKMAAEFTVETNEGVLTGRPGDYVAHDPLSGHVWPLSAAYMEQHYEEF